MKKFLLLPLILLVLFVAGCAVGAANTETDVPPPAQMAIVEDDVDDVTTGIPAYVADDTFDASDDDTAPAIPPGDDIGGTVLDLDILTFRGEVLDSNPMREEAMLLVYSITPVIGHPVGGRYFLTRNDFVIVLDEYGNPISYSDILPGSIIDIAFYGLVRQTDPAVISGAISIQVLKEDNI